MKNETEIKGNPVIQGLINQIENGEKELSITLSTGEVLRVRRVVDAIHQGRIGKRVEDFVKICHNPPPAWVEALPLDENGNPINLLADDDDTLAGLGALKELLIPKPTDIQCLQMLKAPDRLNEIVGLIQGASAIGAVKGEEAAIEAEKND